MTEPVFCPDCELPMEREKRGSGRWGLHCPRCGPSKSERAEKIRSLPALDVLCPPCEVRLDSGAVGTLIAKLPASDSYLVQLADQQVLVPRRRVTGRAA